MYENNPHITYFAADIRRYLNGEMTRDEMYTLEKQAAEDPFLADAIEGYTGITIEAAEADLVLLRSQLNKDEEKKDAKVIPLKTPGGFKWWKQGIAAAIAGLVIFAAATFLKPNKKDKDLAANTPVEKAEIKPAPGAEGAGKTEATNETVSKVLEPSKASIKRPFIHPDSVTNYYFGTINDDVAKLDKPAAAVPETKYRYEVTPGNAGTVTHAVTDSLRINSGSEGVAWGDMDRKKEMPKSAAPPPQVAQEKVAQAENTSPGYNKTPENVAIGTDRSRALNGTLQTNTNSQTVTSEAVTNGLGTRGRRSNDFKDYDVSSSQKRAVAADNFSRGYSFNYKVTDTKGNSIPFSNVSTDDVITYSRSDGTFGLLSHDSVLRVNIKAVGYEPKLFFLNNNTQTANVVLNEESLARDKNLLIVGDQKNFTLRKQKSSEKAKAEEGEEAEPLDGWATYDSYLANNIDISDKVKGEVQLSFEIGKKGEIKSVTVEKSLGAKEDQEAIRLVTQGPKWKGKKKKTKGRVVVTF